MFLFAGKTPLYLSICYFLIPFSFFLGLKGIDLVIKRKSVIATYFIGIATFVSLMLAAFFILVLRVQVPYWCLNFSLPFGALAFWMLGDLPENSVLVRGFVLFFGISFNASAIGCLIAFGERLYRLNKQINKLDD